MKPNNPNSPSSSDNTYANRVAQFQQDQKNRSDSSEKTRKKQKKQSTSLPLSINEAREKVLDSYPTWKKLEILEMEKTNNKDNRFYDQFFLDFLVALGETPSLQLRNRLKGIE